MNLNYDRFRLFQGLCDYDFSPNGCKFAWARNLATAAPKFAEKRNAPLWTVKGTGFKLCLAQQKLPPERCEFIMTQRRSFETDTTCNNEQIFLNAGLYSILNLYKCLGLEEVINEKLGVRTSKGYSDSEHVLSLILMQIAGGSAVEHLSEFNETFSKELGFGIPSPTAERDYLNCFHEDAEDAKRGYGRSFVPESNKHLKGFDDVHLHVLQQAHKIKPLSRITLDQDATYTPTETTGALVNYKGFSSFETLNLFCPEYDIMIATQFRDGNVTPGFGQLEQLKGVIPHLPEGVKEVYFRSDTAGYQAELLKYCAIRDENRRIPIIDFTISCSVEKEFKEAARQVPEKEWKRICKRKPNGEVYETKLECADVVYVPNSLCKSKNSPEYRFIATREKIVVSDKASREIVQDTLQHELDFEIEELERGNENLKKLHMTSMNGQVYKVFGIVTNMLEEEASELVLLHHGRCGKSEEIHRILKDDLAGGHVISKRFGASAAYWHIAVLASSLHNMLKNNFLPSMCRKSRPKTLRFLFYTMAGQIVRHAHKVVLKVYGSAMGRSWFNEALSRMEACFGCT
jgi:hypothetical protein